MSRPKLLALVVCLAGLHLPGACGSPLAPELQVCPQTHSHGYGALPPIGTYPGKPFNVRADPIYGCARLCVVTEFPAEHLPTPNQFVLWVGEARPDGERFFFGYDVSRGPMLITLSRSQPPLSGAGDTLSFWVKASLRGPIVQGAPISRTPDFAIDSLLHVAWFTKVGKAPRVDTLHQTLRVPDAS